MEKILGNIALAAGIVGVLLCAASGLARVAGSYYLAGFEAMTVFNGGVGLMVFSGLLKLELLHRALKDSAS
ncbi:MAG: hypothetical protein ABW086_15120 [Sedimenticola sp.]